MKYKKADFLFFSVRTVGWGFHPNSRLPILWVLPFNVTAEIHYRRFCSITRQARAKMSVCWDILEAQIFPRVTDNWELTVKIFTLKWGKDNERATSSFRCISEAVHPLPVFGTTVDWLLTEEVTMRNEHMCFESFALRTVESLPMIY